MQGKKISDSTKILDGKTIASQIAEGLKRKIHKMPKVPKLAIILIGDDKASASYVVNKKRLAKKLGIKVKVYKLSKNVSTKQVCDLIRKLNKTKTCDGITVELPLPKKFNVRRILDRIKPEKDVDCLTTGNLGKLFTDKAIIYPPIVEAALELLNNTRVKIQGKDIVIIGGGILVGRPLAAYFIQKQATITVCNKSTKNLSSYTKKANILISGVGKAKIITGAMVKKGAIVIDVGFSHRYGKVCGDIDFESVKRKAKFITPCPGGVGPLTCVMLVKNLINIKKHQGAV